MHRATFFKQIFLKTDSSSTAGNYRFARHQSTLQTSGYPYATESLICFTVFSMFTKLRLTTPGDTLSPTSGKSFLCMRRHLRCRRASVQTIFLTILADASYSPTSRRSGNRWIYWALPFHLTVNEWIKLISTTCTQTQDILFLNRKISWGPSMIGYGLYDPGFFCRVKKNQFQIFFDSTKRLKRWVKCNLFFQLNVSCVCESSEWSSLFNTFFFFHLRRFEMRRPDEFYTWTSGGGSRFDDDQIVIDESICFYVQVVFNSWNKVQSPLLLLLSRLPIDSSHMFAGRPSSCDTTAACRGRDRLD